MFLPGTRTENGGLIRVALGVVIRRSAKESQRTDGLCILPKEDNRVLDKNIVHFFSQTGFRRKEPYPSERRREAILF